MLLKKILFIAAFCLLLSRGNTQSLSKSEMDRVQYTIYHFMLENSPLIDSTESEIIMVVLIADSAGKISGIRLLADDQNRGKSYVILSKMTSETFSNLKFKRMGIHTIVVPFYSNSSNPRLKNNYADSIFWDTTFAGENGKIIADNGKSVLLSGIYYGHKGRSD
jgi:hypothetical protein